jgi:hypothetical protein
MVVQVRPKTYDKSISGATAVASVATIDNINPTLLNHYIGVRWYSDSAGSVEVTPTAGTVLIEVFDDVTEQWTLGEGPDLIATDVTDKGSYSSNITSVRATPSDVVGSSHYRLVVVSNIEASTQSEDMANAFETSGRGTTGLGVFVQDQTTPLLTVPFLQTRAVVTLSADTAIDDRVISLVGGHGVVAGEIIELAEDGTSFFMQSEVLSVSVNDITLDQPVNRIYTTTGTSAFASRVDLLIDGSVTPQIFSVLPLPAQSGDMVRVIIEIRGSAGGDMDFTTFGDQAALTNGCVLRIKNEDGTFRNIFNFKSNSDFIEQGYDHIFLNPKIGNTIAGFTSRLTWGGQSKHGVVIRLDGDRDEELQLIIQDDLTGGNTRFHLIAQGHELQEA